MDNCLTFYQSHSPITDPGPYAYLYDDLPDDVEQLFQVINGVFIHKFAADELYQQSRYQSREKYLRTMQQRLGRLMDMDPSPLTVARESKEKQIAFCRDYAVIMTSILRHKGFPARMRVGFEEYAVHTPQYRGDHWITEYWNTDEKRWVLVDSDFGGADLVDIEERSKAALHKGLDFTDLKRDIHFHTAGRAWSWVRTGDVKPELFRVNKRWYGWPVLRGNLLHDFQGLNRLEMGLFDYWDELHFKPMSEMKSRDWDLYDQIARLTSEPEENFDAIRKLFEELPRTRILRSRLQLMGVIGGEEATTRVVDISGSEMARLAAMTNGASTQATTYGSCTDDPEEIDHYTVADTTDIDGSSGITILGARQNNLKNINVHIPRNKFVVITGVSGSGKSSLAFDTIYAEGQRRYVESLSSFARQFTKQMDKPNVDKVIGLNPSVAIEQKTISPNSLSTVGSITEVINFLRLLFARVGRMHCPNCGREVSPSSAQQITRQLTALPTGTRFQVLAHVNRYNRLTISEVASAAKDEGCSHIRINGQKIGLEDFDDQQVEEGDEEQRTEWLIADRTVPEEDGDMGIFHEEVMAAVVKALELGKGVITVLVGDETFHLSDDNLCPSCVISLPKLEPQLLNFNTVYGMCHACDGEGIKLQVDPELIVTHPELSLMDGASPYFGKLRDSSSQWWISNMKGIADYYETDLELPWCDLPETFKKALIYGTEGEKIIIEMNTDDGSFSAQRNRELSGTVHHINRLYRQTKSEVRRRYYTQFMNKKPCPVCHGERLSREARFITLGGTRFPDVTGKSIGDLLDWIRGLRSHLDEAQRTVGDELIPEIAQRLQFICDVGLHYLTIDRPAPTLSGGEAQRIRLASQIGSELMGVLYVLDEPSIGLHTRDHQALLNLLKHLRDTGNTVLVVEHDLDTMREADWIIDLGPGAGVKGGELVAAGTPEEVMQVPESLTGQVLNGRLAVRAPNEEGFRTPQGWLTINGARLHNLKNIDAHFPLGTFTCITGVSGSGKSSLISQTLSPALSAILGDRGHTTGTSSPGTYDSIEGVEQLKRVIHINQAPIGRNPRSNPGTYVGLLGEVRKVFARTEYAKSMKFKPTHFSFNSVNGRCGACDGYGANKVKMHFMADLWVRCGECEGKRFTPQVLDVFFRGQNIADVLEMDVQEAFTFFEGHTKIRGILQMLLDVGLGYIKLGQSALTLSGGEAQRVKLAKELSRNRQGCTLYILDEPTTGLHLVDIQKLLDILHRLADEGNTVMVIEHNLDVIKTADWIIDLGPEGGDEGGIIVAEGTPEDVIAVEARCTGASLQERHKAEYEGKTMDEYETEGLGQMNIL